MGFSKEDWLEMDEHYPQAKFMTIKLEFLKGNYKDIMKIILDNIGSASLTVSSSNGETFGEGSETTIWKDANNIKVSEGVAFFESFPLNKQREDAVVFRGTVREWENSEYADVSKHEHVGNAYFTRSLK